MTERAHETEAPEAGEHVHMPEPSLLPLINAAALAATIVSITLSVILVVVFGIVFLASTAVWIRSTARDVNELPAEH